MKNTEATERIEQSHSAKVEKLFWIAGCLENSELKDLINEMEEEDFVECFPEIAEYYQEYQEDEELIQALIDFRKFGLLAYVLVPECTKFTFQDGRPIIYSINGGVCRVAYCYGETREELLKSIEEKSEQIFQEYIKKHLNSVKSK